MGSTRLVLHFAADAQQWTFALPRFRHILSIDMKSKRLSALTMYMEISNGSAERP